ncbi:MAG: hypothetical protein WEF50_08320 [Myxococcota bacterium]
MNVGNFTFSALPRPFLGLEVFVLNDFVSATYPDGFDSFGFGVVQASVVRAGVPFAFPFSLAS